MTKRFSDRPPGTGMDWQKTVVYQSV